MRYAGLGLFLDGVTNAFIRRRKFEHRDTEEPDTQRKDDPVKVEAEIGVMQQQAKECQGVPLTTSS